MGEDIPTKATKILPLECRKEKLRLLFSENFNPTNQFFLVVLILLSWGRPSKSEVFLKEANNHKSEPQVNGNQSNNNSVIIGHNKEISFSKLRGNQKIRMVRPSFFLGLILILLTLIFPKLILLKGMTFHGKF